jgi:CheY-like chemotaxis protein
MYLPITYVPKPGRRSRLTFAAAAASAGGDDAIVQGAIAQGALPDGASHLASVSVPADRLAREAPPTNGRSGEAHLLIPGDTPLFVSDLRERQCAGAPLAAGTTLPDPVLAGKKVLVVDDDIRNVFAMTSVLEETGMEVHSAETGQAALDALEEIPDMDFVLMDIMMPGMDGYETIRAIRAFAAFRPLPIIAVTAKAMKGDRLKCIQAGASDYVSKPVDIDYLISVMRVSIQRTDASRMAGKALLPEPTA